MVPELHRPFPVQLANEADSKARIVLADITTRNKLLEDAVLVFKDYHGNLGWDEFARRYEVERHEFNLIAVFKDL